MDANTAPPRLSQEKVYDGQQGLGTEPLAEPGKDGDGRDVESQTQTEGEDAKDGEHFVEGLPLLLLVSGLVLAVFIVWPQMPFQPLKGVQID